VAALILAARAARAEARRLRIDSAGLRFAARATAQTGETRIARATQQASVTRARRAIPIASPWSGLAWLRDDESLERILLPID
jgi:O-glycosyl hydrolase